MALIKCNDCGKEYSDQAKNCIHCGAPNNDVKLLCPECGKEITSDLFKCDVCGYVLRKEKKVRKLKIKKSKPKATKEQLFIKITLIVVQLILAIWCLYNYDEPYCSGSNPYEMISQPWYLYFLPAFLIIINTIVLLVNLFHKQVKTFVNFFILVAIFGGGYSALVLLINEVPAFVSFENNYELYILEDSGFSYLSDNESKKRFIDEVHSIFKDEIMPVKDGYGYISSVYYDDTIESFVLTYNYEFYNGGARSYYLSLDFYDNGTIKNLYWRFNDNIKLYIYKNGTTTANFTYYLYMNDMYYIIENLNSEIESILNNKLNLSSNASIEFDDSTYYYKENDTFGKRGTVYDKVNTDFEVIFNKNILETSNDFEDLIDWNVKIK